MMEFNRIQFLTLFLAVCISGGYARAPRKIIRGKSAGYGEFPYMVAIQDLGSHLCGGSILSATHILTAAHCVVFDNEEVRKAENLQVITGTIDNEDLHGDNVFQVAQVIHHEDYTPGVHDWAAHFADVAILKLARSILFNFYQKPIGLPSIDPPPGTSVVSSGWGTSYYVDEQARSVQWLKKLGQKIISRVKCQEAHPGYVNVGHICAMSPPDASTCFGDSGGPLAYNNQVVGIVSWGIKCADGLPDVFTNVYEFRDWIEWAMQS